MGNGAKSVEEVKPSQNITPVDPPRVLYDGPYYEVVLVIAFLLHEALLGPVSPAATSRPSPNAVCQYPCVQLGQACLGGQRPPIIQAVHVILLVYEDGG